MKKDHLVLVFVGNMRFAATQMGKKDALLANYVRQFVLHKLLQLKLFGVKMAPAVQHVMILT